MQDRSQPIRANTEAQSIREEEHPNVPPGTVLQLIDEDNEVEVDTTETPLYPPIENSSLRRYLQCRNRCKPARYQDGVP